MKNEINWFPGHMKKATDEIKKSIKLVDIVVEIVDARAPISTKNPDTDKIISNKKKIIILSKADLAKKETLASYINFYNKNGYISLYADFFNKRDIKKILNLFETQRKKLLLNGKEKGIELNIMKLMVIGLPNVGKSTFINAVTFKKSLVTGNKPGVTKGKQWINLSDKLKLLDTPGIMQTKIKDEETALKIAFLGSIKDELLELDEIYYNLLRYFISEKNKIFYESFEIDKNETEIEKISMGIAKKRGFLIKGGNIDYQRLEKAVISEFRAGKYGKIQLDKLTI